MRRTGSARGTCHSPRSRALGPRSSSPLQALMSLTRQSTSTGGPVKRNGIGKWHGPIGIEQKVPQHHALALGALCGPCLHLHLLPLHVQLLTLQILLALAAHLVCWRLNTWRCRTRGTRLTRTSSWPTWRRSWHSSSGGPSSHQFQKALETMESQSTAAIVRTL